MPNLIVVGSGIKSIAHLTEEAKRVIHNSDKVLYLVNEDNLKDWIERESKNAESLEPIYFQYSKRVDAYHNITLHIINEYHRVRNLCVVFYGHPAILTESVLNAVRQIKAENGNATILPGISAMDCLFSDLEIDPGEHGCFSIDATELLIYERTIDVSSHVILWQIANLGMHDTLTTNKLAILEDYLESYYPRNQLVCIYEAAVLPMFKARIEWIELHELKLSDIKTTSTLYIPPAAKKKLSQKYLDLLEIDTQNYQLSTELNTSPE
ncbi:SAM-dependent methyltransferase [Legionella longbeachae]|uniref:SAM-dependent methyltransferase n=1 Tax=Legionella longbeachae TaxID=450 RepID=UPI0001BEBCA7|nr:SAM-dependent methyltransferase [Legionella longbeachae]EEZ95969.1 tetrapyrrole methylases domain protein [Legionella longbeachae D-4968]